MLGRVLKDLWRARRGAAAASAPATAALPAQAPLVMRYRAEVFDVADEAAARSIILTPEGEASTSARWARETPYLVGLAIDKLALRPGMCVVDFGCGIGRIAREVVAVPGCRVVGVDISASMRRLASEYVRSPSFEAIDPATLAERSDAGERADAAIACWVLQHAMEPQRDIGLLARTLRPGGRLLVVNSHRRVVPSDAGWLDDRLDVAAMLDAHFRCRERGALDPAVVGVEIARHAFVGVYEPH